MKIKNSYLRALVPPVVFLVMQAVVGLFFSLVVVVFHLASSGGDSSEQSLTPSVLALVIILSGILSCLLLWRWKLIRIPEAFSCRRIGVPFWMIAVLAAMLGIVSTDLMSEQLALPDLFGEQMKDMATNVFGVLAIALFGPIVEEVLFREGVQGILLRDGKKPWLAAVFSALCFGLIHGNPAQIPFAFIVGLILAHIYERTRSIAVTSLIHILNNSIAVLEINLLGEQVDGFRYDQFLGLETWMVWTLIAVFALGCVGLLSRLKAVPQKSDESPSAPTSFQD
ncbi:MAG: CPBP family intramembrane metalloprotease [Bacteroidaceae bacterium]|nr:CPBP family intramembrane metalloprotease [Bacteroidaceae bacterium]